MSAVAESLSQGPYLAGTGTHIAGANLDWSNPGNITADDGSYATTAGGSTTDIIAATNFGFALPTDRTLFVVGIEVEVNDLGLGGPNQISIQITKNGTAGVGSAKVSTFPDTVLGWAGAGTSPFGSQADLWGAAYTAAEVNASTFGCLIFGSSFMQQLDAVRMKIYYNQMESRPELAGNPRSQVRALTRRRA